MILPLIGMSTFASFFDELRWKELKAIRQERKAPKWGKPATAELKKKKSKKEE